jgi:hypothetical protein
MGSGLPHSPNPGSISGNAPSGWFRAALMNTMRGNTPKKYYNYAFFFYRTWWVVIAVSSALVVKR